VKHFYCLRYANPSQTRSSKLQAQEAHNMESFVKFGRKCVKLAAPEREIFEMLCGRYWDAGLHGHFLWLTNPQTAIDVNLATPHDNMLTSLTSLALWTWVLGFIPGSMDANGFL